MDDQYQYTIMGVPVDRKPDRAALDAALEAEEQRPRPLARLLNYYDPAIFTTTVAEATVGAILIKELFDRDIAQKTNSPAPENDPHTMHLCNPAHYNSAIQDATLGGRVHHGFFDKFVAIRAIYQVVRTRHPRVAIRQSTGPQDPRGSPSLHAPQDQDPGTTQPRGTQIHHDPHTSISQTPRVLPPNNDGVQNEFSSRPQCIERRKSSRPDYQSPDQVIVQSRLRYAIALPEQNATWAAVKRGRDRTAGRRRSRSPVPFERAFPSDRAHLRNDQEVGSTLRHRQRDSDPALHASASRALGYHHVPHHAPALPAPGDASLHDPPRRDDHASAVDPCSNDQPNHVRDVPDHEHNTVQSDMHENNTIVPNPETPHSSTLSKTEPMQEKNQSAVCVDCWSRGLECDSRAVCRECARANRPCTYVQCPLRDCAKSIICPAYHPWSGDDDARIVGSSMHLMAMLDVDSSFSSTHDLKPIQRMYSKPDSAAGIYCQVASELEEAARAGQGIKREFVKQLIMKQGLTCRALMHKVDLIAKFCAEKK